LLGLRSIMGKILALDYGTKRIGYAVSDDAHTMAFPRGVLATNPRAKLLVTLRSIARDDGITLIVLGMPLNEENAEGESGAKVKRFGELLARTLMLPIHYVDEFGSTNEALTKIPFKRDREAKGIRDAIAAQIILQRYIDAQR